MRTAKHVRRARFPVTVLALLLGVAPARAETVNCTPITTIPFTVTVQGSYCLTGNLATSMTSGSAIEIATNNVVLDLNGFKLGGLGAGLGTHAFGISADGRQNITVRNGTVRGFLEGILIQGDPAVSQGHLIEDIRADQNTFTGITVSGLGSIVRNNQVLATGGSTTGPNVPAFAITASGPGIRVLNNVVSDTVPVGVQASIGIRLDRGPGSVIEGNRIANTALPGPGAQSFGIDVDTSSTNVLVVNNRIATMGNGVIFISGGTGKYRDNLTTGVTAPFMGGIDVGNNN